MRDNIFIKSMLRQPVRSAVLMLLIAAAAFTFVMRGVEYIVVTDKIESASRYYRSIGSLQRAESPNPFANVSAGAEIVSGSQYVAFEDRRRNVAGVLQEMQNGNIAGVNLEFASTFNDAFFYGELTSAERIPIFVPPNIENIEMTIKVDTVLSGYPEHVLAGEEIKMRYFLTEAELEAEAVAKARFEETGEVIETRTAVSNMTVGQRYFLRGVYSDSTGMFAVSKGLPRQGEALDDVYDVLTMRPLNETVADNTRGLSGEGIWYMPAELGEPVDSSAPGLEELEAELERLRYSQSSVYLRTTKDISAMPVMKQQFPQLKLIDGRWLSSDDQLSANLVAMIHEQFARLRGLEVGDTVSVGVPQEQYLAAISGAYEIYNLVVNGSPEDPAVQNLELEIVGLFSYPSIELYLPATGKSQVTLSTDLTGVVYVPDSIIPENIKPGRINQSFEQRGWSEGGDYLPAFMYSFILRDTRDENAFLLENRDALAAAGFNVTFVGTGAENFWVSAEPMLQTAKFNTLVFSAVLLLVLALAVFLYLRQRQGDFAVLRALGCPVGKAVRDLLVSIMLTGIPAAIIGGTAAWYFALNQAEKTLTPLGELVAELNVSLEISLATLWLPALIFTALAILLLMVSAGAAQLARRPVLDLLQGGAAGRRKKAVHSANAGYATNIHAGPSSSGNTMAAKQPLNDKPVHAGADIINKSKRTASKATFRFVKRSVLRSTVKSILAAMIAVFSVLALGFLHETIGRTVSEIDRLYDTTIVNAVIKPEVVTNNIRMFGGVIRPRTVSSVLDRGFAQNVYLESVYEWSIIVPAAADGSLLENWEKILGYDRTSPAYSSMSMTSWELINPLLAFNDMEKFITRHHGEDITDSRAESSMRIDLAEGFSASSFVFTEGEMVPVILYDAVMEQRGIGIGDRVYIAEITVEYSIGRGNVAKGGWRYTPAVVVGIHNGKVNSPFAQMRGAALLPLDAMERIIVDNIGYSVIDFSIDTARNRDIAAVREELQELTASIYAGWGNSISLFLFDEELRTVTGGVEQNLSLLRLLQPIAIVLSVVIGAGLALLLTLQNAKNAAIMRVLGSTRKRTLVVICVEQFVICLFGLITGIGAATILGWGFGATALLGGLYSIGVIIGSIIGGVLVTNRPPLELLQVKE